jgi:hypothetical protein
LETRLGAPRVLPAGGAQPRMAERLLNHSGSPKTLAFLGRYVSVALSFESPRQDVILHPAL